MSKPMNTDPLVFDKLYTINRQFILMQENQIDSVAKDWNDMRDYCSETGKNGHVYIRETVIPFGGKLDEITTQTRYFGKIG